MLGNASPLADVLPTGSYQRVRILNALLAAGITTLGDLRSRLGDLRSVRNLGARCRQHIVGVLARIPDVDNRDEIVELLREIRDLLKSRGGDRA